MTELFRTTARRRIWHHDLAEADRQRQTDSVAALLLGAGPGGLSTVNIRSALGLQKTQTDRIFRALVDARVIVGDGVTKHRRYVHRDHWQGPLPPAPPPLPPRQGGAWRPELYSKPAADRPKRTRSCLCCGRPFRSEGAHNRLCQACRQGDDRVLGQPW